MKSLLPFAAGLLLVLAGCAAPPQPSPSPTPQPTLGAGFRYSTYSASQDPGPDYWNEVGLSLSEKFPGAHPETI